MVPVTAQTRITGFDLDAEQFRQPSGAGECAVVPGARRIQEAVERTGTAPQGRWPRRPAVTSTPASRKAEPGNRSATTWMLLAAGQAKADRDHADP